MNRELINEATKALIPLSVKLRSLDVSMEEEFDPDLNPETVFETFFRFKALKHKVFEAEEAGKNLVKVYATSGVRLAREETKDPADFVVEIKADFVVTYALLDGETPCSEALSEFAKHNSPLHIWPYWRELLNNMGDRFGFGQIILPMYRVRDDKKAEPPEKAVKKKKIKAT
jgi:hypothetical protein